MTDINQRKKQEIRALCKKHNMTQEELAEKADTKPDTISLIILGKCKPRKLTLEHIAMAFGMTVEELLDYKEEA